ncbi:hypothetical protein SAMN02745121_08800 [Nannocystis exedens]|uniref:Thaumatin family protein n=1 Tax=Nannocystis exedens TaxID=54 RepID=A0A1I2IM50_9BACT|nr:hypothetical protein [Nannocystis exedens]PCC72523.1 hypothetical protein NAEX_05603 [Nannocystis exedens]SFF42760.1 hypothetical protein SAMN02745121_08800 [Nannocystis exedens]
MTWLISRGWLFLLLAMAAACATDAERCARHNDDQSGCEAAGCNYWAATEIVAGADGCRTGEPVGFCSEELGMSSEVWSIMYVPGPEPRAYRVVGHHEDVPDDWVACSCFDANAPAACACKLDEGCKTPILSLCEGFADAASCNHFQGEVGFNGCVWTESAVQTRVDAQTCSREPPVGRCVAVNLRGEGEGCWNGQPPSVCAGRPEQPYFKGIPGALNNTAEIFRDIPCEFTPIDLAPCWSGETQREVCECPCLP